MDGKAFPYVPFDIGESYAGNLPIRRPGAANATGTAGNSTADQELFFWLFPSENPEATDEILIWLNGGVSVWDMLGHVHRGAALAPVIPSLMSRVEC